MTNADKTKNVKEYEFIDEELNIVIRKLSNDMRFVGLFLYVFGGLTVLGGVLMGGLDKSYVEAIHYLLTGGITILIGIGTTNAATSFKLIEKTQDNDIKHLMDAFREVRNVYRFQLWFLILAPVYLIVIGALL